MKKLFYLVLIVFSMISCSSKQVNTSDQVDLISLDNESKLVSDILLDDKFSIDDLKLRMPVFLNMLKAAADNEEDVNLRLYAQELSYIYTELLLTKYDNMQGEDQELIESYMKELIYPSNKWFYNDDEEMPHIWKDQYYCSNKSAEESVKGFFHIMLVLPTEIDTLPSLQVFYPDCAIDAPQIAFQNYYDADGKLIEDKLKNLKLLEFDKWVHKDEIMDGYPMCAVGYYSLVQQLFNHDTMYLLFKSKDAPSGEAGELEIARIQLAPLQIKMKELSNQL